MYKKLIKQTFLIGEDIIVQFDSFVDEPGPSVIISKGEDKITFSQEEAKLIKEIMEDTNYIFSDDNTLVKNTDGSYSKLPF